MAQYEQTLVVKGGPHPRLYTPVFVDLPRPKELAIETLSLQDLDTGDLVVWQPILSQEDRIRITWVVGQQSVGQDKRYLLSGPDLSLIEKTVAGVELQERDHQVAISVGGKLFTVYHYAPGLPRPFFYPMLTSSGLRVTRGYPMEVFPEETRDHRHHRSVWTAYGDVNGVDNWSEEGEHGWIRHQRFTQFFFGPVCGGFTALNLWTDHKGNPILEESRECQVWNLPEGPRFMDLTLTFSAPYGDVKFGDTKEGGLLSVRVASSMDVSRGGRIENSEGGINEEQTWGRQARWCDYSGPVAGQWAGIALFDHPSNFRHPTYFHVRNYGLMTANPFGISVFERRKDLDGSYTIKRGEALTFRYRLVVHLGTPQEVQLETLYQSWVSPVEVVLV